MPPALNVSEQDLCSHCETSNTTNTCENDEENNRIKRKFVSDIVLIYLEETSLMTICA